MLFSLVSRIHWGILIPPKVSKLVACFCGRWLLLHSVYLFDFIRLYSIWIQNLWIIIIYSTIFALILFLECHLQWHQSMKLLFLNRIIWCHWLLLQKSFWAWNVQIFSWFGRRICWWKYWWLHYASRIAILAGQYRNSED